jgi:hypothetical protein
MGLCTCNTITLLAKSKFVFASKKDDNKKEYICDNFLLSQNPNNNKIFATREQGRNPSASQISTAVSFHLDVSASCAAGLLLPLWSISSLIPGQFRNSRLRPLIRPLLLLLLRRHRLNRQTFRSAAAKSGNRFGSPCLLLLQNGGP